MASNLPPGQTLSDLVKARYDAAKAAGSLVFSPTELAIVHPNNGIPFQLRYCPALAKKPTTDKAKDADNTTTESKPKRHDPFDNPPADLLITQLPADSAKPSHILVLNKYPVIPQHFILATKTNKPQTHFLEKDDLAMTYACLQAWEDTQDDVGTSSDESGSATTRGEPVHKSRRTNSWDGNQKARRLFAFFNSGKHSGASQPHRHIQFLPIEEMQAQEPANSNWKLLLETMNTPLPCYPDQVYNPWLPFRNYAAPIPPNPSPDTLLAIYEAIYDNALYSVEDQATEESHLEIPDQQPNRDIVPISYNLAMTTSTMAICARRAEGAMVKDNWGADVGFVALNGTMLGGTLMVKGEKEWDFLRGPNGGTKLKVLLMAVGIPQEPLERDGRSRAGRRKSWNTSGKPSLFYTPAIS